jgi:hypothetical protein
MAACFLGSQRAPLKQRREICEKFRCHGRMFFREPTRSPQATERNLRKIPLPWPPYF